MVMNDFLHWRMKVDTASGGCAPFGSIGELRQLQYVHALAQPKPFSFQFTSTVKLGRGDLNEVIKNLS